MAICTVCDLTSQGIAGIPSCGLMHRSCAAAIAELPQAIATHSSDFPIEGLLGPCSIDLAAIVSSVLAFCSVLSVCPACLVVAVHIAGRRSGGAVMKKKKTRSVQYALRWRPVGNRWRLVGNRWRLVGNRWRLVGNRWRLVGNRWWLVCNRWRLVCNRWRLVGNRWRLVCNRWRLVGNRWRLLGSHQTSESGCHSKKKKGSASLWHPLRFALAVPLWGSR